MIGFHSAHAKNFHLPQRIQPTALDQERSFLAFIVARQVKKRKLPGIEVCRLPQKQAYPESDVNGANLERHLSFHCRPDYDLI